MTLQYDFYSSENLNNDLLWLQYRRNMSSIIHIEWCAKLKYIISSYSERNSFLTLATYPLLYLQIFVSHSARKFGFPQLEMKWMENVGLHSYVEPEPGYFENNPYPVSLFHSLLFNILSFIIRQRGNHLKSKEYK